MNKDIEFTMPDGYALADLKRVQTRLLEMAKIVTGILDQNGYKYFIAFGTLLGAVRHEGFIPWDDDFDLFLFDDEYDKAVECIRQNLPPDLIVHDQKSDPSYYAAWSKIRDLKSDVSSAAYPGDNKHRYTGINLDLYRLCDAPRKMAKAWLRRERLEFLVRKYDVGILPDKDYEEMFPLWAKEYVDALPTEAVDEKDRVYVFQIFVTQLEKSDVLPLKRYVFEDCAFWGPACADSFLRQAYGDYMALPAPEKRKPHCNRVKFL